MKYCGRMLVCVVAGVALNVGAIVTVPDAKGGPYQTIARRNIFGLVPPVSSRNEKAMPVVSRPKITLAGITTLLGRKIAFLMLPAKPGGVRECLLLREGETQEEILVREIGEKTVRVINHGEKQSLGFDDSPLPPVSGPADEGTPVVPKSPMQMPAPEKPLTSEQQALIIEAQRMKAIQIGDPLAKILPPTEMTPEVTGEGGSQ